MPSGQGDQAANLNPMNQSFYSKQGLDFLYFARPGTAYGTGAFMTQTASGFYDQGTKQVKPIELIKSKNTSFANQLWFQRAEKVKKQLDYMQLIFDFLSYASLISNRFTQDYIPQLKPEQDKSLKIKKNELIKEMRGMIELYSSY